MTNKLKIFDTIENSNADEIKKIIKEDAAINCQDAGGFTPLMIIIERSINQISYPEKIEIVKLLIEHGAEIDIFNNFKMNALIIAVIEGYLEIVKLLIEHGADSDVRCYDESLVNIAKNYKYDEIVKFLSEVKNVK